MSLGKIIPVIIVLMILIVPVFSFAQGITSGLVYECVSGGVYGNCTWEDVILAIRNAINVVTQLAIGFSVVIIAWAGFKYMTSEGNPGKIREATGMFTKVAIGMGFIICAWVIVQLIASGLGVTSFTFTP